MRVLSLLFLLPLVLSTPLPEQDEASEADIAFLTGVVESLFGNGREAREMDGEDEEGDLENTLVEEEKSMSNLVQETNPAEIERFNAYMDAIYRRMNAALRAKLMDPMELNLNRKAEEETKKKRKAKALTDEDDDDDTEDAEEEEDDEDDSVDRMGKADKEKKKNGKKSKLTPSQKATKKAERKKNKKNSKAANKDKKENKKGKGKGKGKKGKGKKNKAEKEEKELTREKRNNDHKSHKNSKQHGSHHAAKSGKNGKKDKEEKDEAQEMTRQKRNNEHKNHKKNNKKSGNKKSSKKQNKGKKQSKKQTREDVSKGKTMGALSGIATLRRNGDVEVMNADGHVVVKSQFSVGPLQLEVSKQSGRGSSKSVQTAKAITEKLAGKMLLKVKTDGSAHVKSVYFQKPDEVSVKGSLGDKKSRSDRYLENSMKGIRPLAAQRVLKMARFVLRSPSTVERS